MLEYALIAGLVFGLYFSLVGLGLKLASSLSGGQRKMLGIAKALAGNPRLLIMDEPAAGLSPLFVKEVIHALKGFHATSD